MKYEESKVSNKIYNNIINSGYNWNTEYSEPFIKGIIEGMAELLSDNDFQNPTCIIITDGNKDNEFVLGAYKEKIEAEKGYGYSIDYTLEDDIPESYDRLEINNNKIYDIIKNILSNKYNCKLTVDNETMEKLAAIVFKSIKDYMKENYSIDNTFEVNNCFTLTSSMEDDGSFYIVFAPSETIKQIIKNDEFAQI